MTAAEQPGVTRAAPGHPMLKIRELVDRADIAAVVDRYFLALDEGRFDDACARRTFSDDVSLSFPPGDHEGIDGLAAFTSGFMRHWTRTHHLNGNYLIDVNGDRASLGWNVFATHVHPDSPPPPASGHLFHLGGRFTGSARRTRAGWRIERLTLRISWALGTGVPSIVATMARGRGEAETAPDGPRQPPDSSDSP